MMFIFLKQYIAMKTTIDINARCNLRCVFCYQDLDGSVLPADQIYERATSGKTIGIGGGEPLLDSRITC